MMSSISANICSSFIARSIVSSNVFGSHLVINALNSLVDCIPVLNWPRSNLLLQQSWYSHLFFRSLSARELFLFYSPSYCFLLMTDTDAPMAVFFNEYIDFKFVTISMKVDASIFFSFIFCWIRFNRLQGMHDPDIYAFLVRLFSLLSRFGNFKIRIRTECLRVLPKRGGTCFVLDPHLPPFCIPKTHF